MGRTQCVIIFSTFWGCGICFFALRAMQCGWLVLENPYPLMRGWQAKRVESYMAPIHTAQHWGSDPPARSILSASGRVPLLSAWTLLNLRLIGTQSLIPRWSKPLETSSMRRHPCKTRRSNEAGLGWLVSPHAPCEIRFRSTVISCRMP